jgi:hypothetical protein
MRFNSKELSTIACQPRERFDKEGVLLVKEKQEGLFRKGEGKPPHFCHCEKLISVWKHFVRQAILCEVNYL